MPVKEVIHLTQVDGVLDSNKEVIPEITEENWEAVQESIYEPKGYDITGGMKHKIETALKYAKKGVTTRILNGEKPDVFNQAGTTITSRQSES
jgi:isopentenyl phosphate kinase